MDWIAYDVVSQLLGFVNPIVQAILLVFAVMFWIGTLFLAVYAIYYFLGATPGMRGRALESMINWAEAYIKWIIGVYIILWLVISAMSLLASASGGSFSISLGTVLNDLVIKPIVNAFHYIYS